MMSASTATLRGEDAMSEDSDTESRESVDVFSMLRVQLMHTIRAKVSDGDMLVVALRYAIHLSMYACRSPSAVVVFACEAG